MLVVVARRGEKIGYVVVVQGVMSVAAGAAHPHEPQAPW